jgi:hypothetical protein
LRKRWKVGDIEAVVFGIAEELSLLTFGDKG